MKTMKNRLKKCCQRAQPGKPVVASGCDDARVPGYRLMNCCTEGSPRKPLATATATMSSPKPIGSNQSRLNHRLWPRRTRGAMPFTWGTEPAQVAGSITSSPGVSCQRSLRTRSGETLDGAGAGRSSGVGSESVPMV